MTVTLWSICGCLWLVLAVLVLWWGWTEDEGRVVPGEDHAEVVARMRMLQGGKR